MENLSDLQNRINHLDSDKLVQIVKNYQQYGYTEDTRNYALQVLELRGISRQDLQLTGNLENHSFEVAKRTFASFKLYSTIAFTAYLFLAFSRLFQLQQYIYSDPAVLAYILISLLALIIFAACLFRSFMIQSDFYKMTGDSYNDGALVYLLLGLPLYIIMYFVFINQMAEKMKSIT